VVVDSSTHIEKYKDIVQLLVGTSTSRHRVHMYSLDHSSLLGRRGLLERKAGVRSDRLLGWKLTGIRKLESHLPSASWIDGQWSLLFNLFPAYSQKAHTSLTKFPVKYEVQHWVPADRHVSPILTLEMSKKDFSDSEDEVLLWEFFYDIFFLFNMS